MEVMNDLKQKYRFIDLLEAGGLVVPLLVALEPSALAKIAKVRQYRKEAWAVRYSGEGRPEGSRKLSRPEALPGLVIDKARRKPR